MPVLFTANFPAGSREAAQLRRILWHAKPWGGPTVRLCVELLPHPVAPDPRGHDMAHLHACAQLDEDAGDILFIFAERASDAAAPTPPRTCRVPITLPDPLGIELDDETGRFTVRSLPDRAARVLH